VRCGIAMGSKGEKNGLPLPRDAYQDSNVVQLWRQLVGMRVEVQRRPAILVLRSVVVVGRSL
jgi:hypothetical protein